MIQESSPTERLTKSEAFKTQVKGIPGYIFCFIGGIGLSFTGIGAIIGIPLILYGLFGPFVNYWDDYHSIIGHCPYCEHDIKVKIIAKGKTCPACKNRIVVKADRFYSVQK